MRVETKLKIFAPIVAVIVILAACGFAEKNDSPDDVISAAVSILPQKYFLEKVGGDRTEITVVVPPGAGPASYEPSPSDMRAMSDVKVWFTVGVAFEEPWIPRFTGSNPDLIVVNTAEDIPKKPLDRYSIQSLVSEGAVTGAGSPDPHVWLSPELVRVQAGRMAETLAELDPARAYYYTANLENFNREIDSLQAYIHSLLDTLSFRGFMVFHPAWGYFADEFGLFQVPVENAGSDPSPGEMAMLVDFAVSHGISTIFVSPQFNTSPAKAIAAEIGAEIAYIDPLAPDWSDNLGRVAEAIARLSGSQEAN